MKGIRRSEIYYADLNPVKGSEQGGLRPVLILQNDIGNKHTNEVNDENDNPPIGIILCTDKGNCEVQYALGGISNQIFASKYVLYMPDKEQLIAQVEKVLQKWHGNDE